MAIKLWHGGNRWVRPPEIRPPRKGHCEYGPGLYFTTSLQVAEKYAKGNKVITLAEIEVKKWLKDAATSFQEVIEFVESTRWKGKHQLISHLNDSYERYGDETKDWLFMLLSNFVYTGLSGKAGVELANFLAERGVDASCDSSYGVDTVVVFNPKAIVKWEVVPSKEIDWTQPNLPRVDTSVLKQKDHEPTGWFR